MNLSSPGAESRYTGIAMVGLCGTVFLTIGALMNVPIGWWVWLGGVFGAALVFRTSPRGRFDGGAYARGVVLALIFASLCPLVVPKATPLLVGVVIMLYACTMAVLSRALSERG